MLLLPLFQYLCFLFTTLPSYGSTKLSHPLLSLHAMVRSSHHVYNKLLYRITPRLTLFCSQPNSLHSQYIKSTPECSHPPLSRNAKFTLGTHQRLHDHQWIETQPPIHPPSDYPTPNQLPLSAPPIEHNTWLQEHLQIWSIMASKSIFKLDWSLPSIQSPRSHYNHLQSASVSSQYYIVHVDI